jgi:hypothetical protein
MRLAPLVPTGPWGPCFLAWCNSQVAESACLLGSLRCVLAVAPLAELVCWWSRSRMWSHPRRSWWLRTAPLIEVARHNTQAVSPQFPKALVGPPPVRKCHQMASKEHIQLGWVVRWVLSTPPGPPHGWAVFPCRASTSLAPLYSPCASLAFGWGSKLLSRSALAPVESPPGALTNALSVSSAFYPRDSCLLFRAIWLQNEIETTVLPQAPRRDALSCSPRQTKSRAATYRRAPGSLDKTDRPEVSLVDFTSFPKPHSISSHSRPRIFHLISSSATENIRDGRTSDTRHGLSPGTCVRSQPPAVSGDLNSRISEI